MLSKIEEDDLSMGIQKMVEREMARKKLLLQEQEEIYQVAISNESREVRNERSDEITQRYKKLHSRLS